MDSLHVIGLMGLIGIWLIWTWFSGGQKDELGIAGELVWIDRGKNTKPFFNREYRIFGKPDLMYQIKNGILAVEYKGRKNNIYKADIIQGMTASLAARGQGYKVNRLLVRTDGSERYIDLPSSDRALYKLVSENIEIVREAKRGKALSANPAYYKCLNCAYSDACTKK